MYTGVVPAKARGERGFVLNSDSRHQTSNFPVDSLMKTWQVQITVYKSLSVDGRNSRCCSYISTIYFTEVVFPSFRSCVNGALLCSVTQLWHGDRILWGNNHFFR